MPVQLLRNTKVPIKDIFHASRNGHIPLGLSPAEKNNYLALHAVHFQRITFEGRRFLSLIVRLSSISSSI